MHTILNPLFFFAIILVMWHCYRLRSRHYQFWRASLFSPRKISVRHIVSGAVAGTVLSIIFILSDLDFAFTIAGMWWLWAAVLILGLVRVRFMGISYAAGLVSLLALISQSLDPVLFGKATGTLLASLQQINLASLLLFAGIMTVVSGLLTIFHGDRAYCPLLLPWRGKSVGAVFLQSLWSVPVLLHTSAGWLLLPVLTVYTDLAVSRFPQKRARMSGLVTIGFGLTIAVFGWVGFRVGALLWAGAVWSLIGQPLISWWAIQQERSTVAKFQPSTNGIRVLAVKEGSPAAEMGILPGETITRVNGQAVNDMTALYAALQRSPAFCKLEIVDASEEQRFVQRSRYAGEPHQLGIVPVHVTSETAVIDPYRYGLWRWLFERTDYRRTTISEQTLDQ